MGPGSVLVRSGKRESHGRRGMSLAYLETVAESLLMTVSVSNFQSNTFLLKNTPFKPMGEKTPRNFSKPSLFLRAREPPSRTSMHGANPSPLLTTA